MKSWLIPSSEMTSRHRVELSIIPCWFQRPDRSLLFDRNSGARLSCVSTALIPGWLGKQEWLGPQQWQGWSWGLGQAGWCMQGAPSNAHGHHTAINGTENLLCLINCTWANWGAAQFQWTAKSCSTPLPNKTLMATEWSVPPKRCCFLG